ncbi:MAG TPA: lipid-A-disaccharide synthase [Zeimonas sp.]
MPAQPARREALALGMVAGEASGDVLAASLLAGIAARVDRLHAAGIGGPSMRRHGFDAWWTIDALSVNGYLEVLREYPRLRRMRNALRERLLQWRPNVFVGVDAPDFNLDLERALRERGVRVLHFIGPSIWAWRRERIRKIAASVDRILLLFPFEEALYREAGVDATFVGHPLADVIPLEVDVAGARRVLGLPGESAVVALLPGSRPSEIEHLAAPFLATAAWLHERRADLRFVVPAASDAAFERLKTIAAQARLPSTMALTIVRGRAHDALAAADAVLVASGTATLEAALFRKPMVIAYRMSAISYRIMRPMALLPYVGLPNVLAERFVVPEFLQNDVQPSAMGEALLRQLEDAPYRASIVETFASLHQTLRRGCAARAAQAVLEVADDRAVA